MNNFIRAFKQFAETRLLQTIHKAMIEENVGDEKLVGHISGDSTAIKGREKACRKNTPKNQNKNKRGRPKKGEKKEFAPARKLRYNERSTAERVNADLKDNFGGLSIRVKGHGKVFAHLMFGLVAITGKQLFNMLA